MRAYAMVAMMVFSCLAFGCQEAEPVRELEKVTLQLKWVHQAQFAGFYMAKEQGFYAEEKLDASFLEGGKDISQVDRLHLKEADFAVIPAESLFLSNDDENKIVALAVIYQRNPTMFVSHKNSGIIRPQDIVGKSVAVGDMEEGFIEGIIQLRALFKSLDLDHDTLQRQDYDPSYKAFIAGEVDITPAYLVGGVIKLRRKGIALNLIWPGDYGIDFYSDTLATTAEFLQMNPNIAARFVRASLKGWRECIRNQELCVSHTMKYAQIKDRSLQDEMMRNQVVLVNTGETPVGWMQAKVWQNMYQMFSDHALVNTPIEDIQSVYSMRILEEIYEGRDE